MNELTLANGLSAIAEIVAKARIWQIDDPAHPDYGAIYNRDWGVAEPKITGKFLVSCGYLALANALPDERLLPQANLAADYLLRARRPSGLIDFCPSFPT